MRTSSETAQCSKCLRNLPVDNFRFKNVRDNRRHNICRACRSIHDKVTRDANREEYDALLAAQDHCCAICGITAAEIGRKLFIDHDHETLKVRGLLCWKCNSGLGFFDDDQSKLAIAIEYLIKNEATS